MSADQRPVPLTDAQVDEILAMRLTTSVNAYVGHFETSAEEQLYRQAVEHYNARILAINEVVRLRARVAELEPPTGKCRHEGTSVRSWIRHERGAR